MNIVLIGYRGSGKTSVGRRVADLLGLRFVDTDEAVVDRFAGRSIRAIWEEFGEPVFRRVECEVIAELLGDDGRVVAFGGGAVMQPAVRAELAAAASRCCVVYLRATAETLGGRIAADRATAEARPSLSGVADSAEEVRRVLAGREPTYEAVADHAVEVDELGIEAVAETVVARVRGLGPGASGVR